MQEWLFTLHLGACDMEISLKAIRKPSHDILSNASFFTQYYWKHTILFAQRFKYLDIWSLNKIMLIIK